VLKTCMTFSLQAPRVLASLDMDISCRHNTGACVSDFDHQCERVRSRGKTTSCGTGGEWMT